MVLLTYTGRASRVHIGDGIVIQRGRPTEVHPLLGLPFRGRRDFDVIELDLDDRLVFLDGAPAEPVAADPDATAEPAESEPEPPRRRRHASIEPETEPLDETPDEPADPPTPDQPKET